MPTDPVVMGRRPEFRGPMDSVSATDAAAPFHSSWPLMYAVVLNWNGFDDTKRCIVSIEENGYPNLRIIVVDNASSDGSRQRLMDETHGLEVIFNSRNDGFGRGCNIGIRRALEDKECEYVLLINNDATLHPGALCAAVARAQSSGNIGLVGGKIMMGKASQTIWSVCGSLDLLRGQAVGRGTHQLDRGQFNTPVPVTFVTCALALVSRSVFERSGLIPEEYFFGIEEWDFSLTTRRAGFELWYEPKFVAYHPGDGSHCNSDPKYVYNSYRSKLIFKNKYSPQILWSLWFGVFEHVYVRLFAYNHLKRMHRQNGGDANALFYALKAAIRDHKRLGIVKVVEEDLTQFEQELRSERPGHTQSHPTGLAP